MQPWKILSSSVSVGVLTEGWNLAEPSPGAEEERVFQVTVFFATPFDAPPVVHLGLTGFDIDQRDSDRLKIRAAEINAYRFVAEIVTWRETRVYSAEFSWLAIGG